MNQFKVTFNHFKPVLEELDYDNYWDWMLIPDDLKAVALYIQFYDQITLAWAKTQKPFIEEETAVSTLMQYLIKNVDIIKENRKRFTPNYLYKVAFNALYPLGRIQRDIDYYYNEHTYHLKQIKNLIDWTEIYDPDNPAYVESMFIEKKVTVDVYFDDSCDDEIWSIIEVCDESTKKVIESLIGGKKLGKKLQRKSPEIISELKIKLKNFT